MTNPRMIRGFVGIFLIAGVAACRPAPSIPVDTSEGATIVFVHGAWGGGWQYHKVEPLLRQAGHLVFRPTMTGLGERVHLADPEVGLSTHVQDIVNVLEFEDLRQIVLVGHSYGGMVISGVAERVPHRIAQLVYFDAIVPEDGESLMDLSGGRLDQMAVAEGDGGEPWKLVPRWVEDGKPPPVDVPQPLLTFTEAIRLGNPEAKSLPTAFILTVEAGKETDDFDVFADRARARGALVVKMTGSHNPHWYQPETFAEVLLGVVMRRENLGD